MSDHTCDAIVVTCIDFRIQPYIESWLVKVVGSKNYDRVSLAGGIFDVYTILKQVEISNRLHHIKKVVYMNHEDCGAYGALGTDERHRADLLEAQKKTEMLFPHLAVETYYVRLSGTIENISGTPEVVEKKKK